MTESGGRRQLVLASASPARLRLLRDAGFDPVPIVSGIDESAQPDEDGWALVERLAATKASAVAAGLHGGEIVIGCDSMLLIDGAARGKPGTADVAVHRWRSMRGRPGSLLTGHCVIDTATGRRAAAVVDTVVRFADPTDDEIAAYVATGEPLQVAGGFTIDGRGALFVEGIDGDPSNVVGLSLPALRNLLSQLGVAIMDVWQH